MPRLKKIGLDNAEGRTKELLEKVDKKLGRIPNIFQGFAHSPATLEFVRKVVDNRGTGCRQTKRKPPRHAGAFAFSVAKKTGGAW